MKFNFTFVLIIFSIVIAILAIIAMDYFSSKESNTQPKVGIILSGSITDGGWNKAHYIGIKKACETLGLEFEFFENIDKDKKKLNEAIKTLIKNDVKIIFLSSFSHTNDALNTIRQHPDVYFVSNDASISEKNITSYFVRMYQPRYLAGIIAGLTTKTNEIGYIAGYNIPEVNRGISAFTIGAKKVNPNIKVWVSFTNTWDNNIIEEQKTEDLLSHKNIDVVTYHQNVGDSIIKIADKYNAYTIGYHHQQNYSKNNITSVIANWYKSYLYILQKYLQGNLKIYNYYWIGVEEDVVSLSDIAPFVSNDIKKLVENEKEKIMNGEDVFINLIKDNSGNIICNEGERLSDTQLLEEFNWLVEGVYIYER
ncbi:MAG: BMP family ABC transporter substrate-binding protein [Succinivibrionaceae bacterium]